jgi:hypothetical protein
MKDTAAPSTGPGDGYDAIVTNGSVTAIRDVEITHEKSAEARKAAWLVVAMVVIAMALRPGIASIGPVLPLISREFSLSHATASLLTTIPTLLMGLLALPTPWLARRFGRNGTLLASLVLLFVSMVARAFAPNARTSRTTRTRARVSNWLRASMRRIHKMAIRNRIHNIRRCRDNASHVQRARNSGGSTQGDEGC